MVECIYIIFKIPSEKEAGLESFYALDRYNNYIYILFIYLFIYHDLNLWLNVYISYSRYLAKRKLDWNPSMILCSLLYTLDTEQSTLNAIMKVYSTVFVFMLFYMLSPWILLAYGVNFMHNDFSGGIIF